MRLFMSRLFCYYMMWGKPCLGLPSQCRLGGGCTGTGCPANDGWEVESLRLGDGIVAAGRCGLKD